MKMLQKEQHFNMASEGLVVNDAKLSCSPYSECGTRAIQSETLFCGQQTNK